jgi:PAS domain S-box-containing protein
MLTGITILFFCSVLAIRHNLIYNNLHIFESQAADKVNYFDQVLQFQQTTLEMFTFDPAVNKAVINFLHNRNLPALQETLLDAMPSFGVDAVWIYDADYQLIHHESYLLPQAIRLLPPAPKNLAGMFQRGSRYRHFFTTHPDALMEIRSAPIGSLNSTASGRAYGGTLLAGRLWSDDYIRILEKTSGADLRILPIHDNITTEPVYNPSTGRLHFSRVLFDENRIPLHILSASYVTPLIAAFNHSSNIQVAVLLIFGIATVCMLIWCFTAWVIAPLKKISTALRSSSPSPVHEMTRHRNEFGIIAQLIQDFFKQKDSLVAEINERCQVEQALRHSQERFRALVETTSDVTWEVDADFTVTYVSPRATEVFGYTPNELIGRHILNIIVADDGQTGTGTAEAVFKRRIPFNSFVYRARRKDGRMLFIEASGVPIHDETGCFQGYRGIDRDITERKQIEAQLQQALKMEAVGTLAGGIAHDFNNILTVIIGNTQLAQLSVAHGSAAHNCLDQILQASQRAGDMVRQILDFSRQAPSEKAPINVMPLVRDVLKMLQASLPSYITIHTQMVCEHDVISANPSQIHQILMNLCVNAAHAMEPDGGILSVRIDTVTMDRDTTEELQQLKKGPYIRIRISDTGCGIPADLLPRIFDPFFTTKDVKKGTGLGLSVVLGIARQHNGDVRVESAPGKGSTFSVLLPLSDSTPLPAQSHSAPVQGGGARILAVDDEKQVADMMEYMLQHLGYITTVTTDSREALELFKSAPDAYDLVISDLTMPHMTGTKLVSRLREIRQDIPVILTSGFKSNVRDGEYNDLTIQAFIKKPFILDELAKALHRVLNR